MLTEQFFFTRFAGHHTTVILDPETAEVASAMMIAVAVEAVDRVSEAEAVTTTVCATVALRSAVMIAVAGLVLVVAAAVAVLVVVVAVAVARTCPCAQWTSPT